MARSSPQIKPFDRKCSVLGPTVTVDASGGPVETYAVVKGPVWCRRDDTGGREVRVAGALRGESDCRFTLRWYDGLSSDMRIRCEGRTYDIISPPIEVGRRQYWVVECAEREGQT